MLPRFLLLLLLLLLFAAVHYLMWPLSSFHRSLTTLFGGCLLFLFILLHHLLGFLLLFGLLVRVVLLELLFRLVLVLFGGLFRVSTFLVFLGFRPVDG